MTPVKYECDTNNLTGTSARSKILLTEKLTNGALVTPTLGTFQTAIYICGQYAKIMETYKLEDDFSVVSYGR